ncbi:MAG: protein kinase [Acidobacteria bacterium]|nr:protein kinase [Acidobacteriota bacterium]
MQPEAAERVARRRIGRYVITGRLGRGGMGVVYEGLDEALDRKAAIKTLISEGLVDEDGRRRFEVEARAAARLQHPNIVIVYELGEDRGVKFIAMELLPGLDLEELLRSGEEMLLAEKLDIAIQVCRGLAYAHERHVFHRDIKPANIRLLDDGTVRIMDFGIAKLEGTQLTKTGVMVGTVHYMSPEQVRGKKLDGRTDVFSVGVILYQLLSGQRPFQGENPTQVLYKIVSEPPPPLDLSPLGEAGPRLEAIVGRALAKDREQRYQGASELADDLQRELDEIRKSTVPAPDPTAMEALATARRKIRSGKVDDAIAQLRTLVSKNPYLLDAHRELRTARRERERMLRTPTQGAVDFPELDATFQAAPTRLEPPTDLQPTIAVSEPDPPPSPPRRGLLWVLAGVIVLAAGFGFSLLRGGQGPPVPAEARVPVRSQPLGAAVLIDGADSGVTTNGVLVLPSPVPEQVELTFRKAGHRDETRTVHLPLPASQTVSVTLQSAVAVTPVRTDPAGATVTLDGGRVAGVTPLEIALDPQREHVLGFALDGHVPGEVTVAAGETPEVIEARLDLVPPPGHVAVASSYPVDVLWQGKALVRGVTSPRVELPSGRQVITLASSRLLLRTDVPVSVPAGGLASIEAPGVGEINIRALPDNCEVLIDGTSKDYPPILERALAAGHHTVTFRWPDGVTSQQAVEVVAGRSAYVTGRKD